MRSRIAFAALTLTILLPLPALAQVSLTGTYITYLAIESNGTMVQSSTAHSMAYTETGSPPTTCDVFYPGTPREGFTVQATAGATMIMATNNEPPTFGTSDFVTTTPTAVSGRNITWSGTYTSGTTSIRADETYSYQMDDRSVDLHVVLNNVGTTTLTDIYYLRNADPDHASCGLSGTSTTTNDVVLQPPTDSAALVTAGAMTPAGEMVLGIGIQSIDARGYTGGFSNTDGRTEWTTPMDHAGAPADEAIDVILHITSLAVGASTSFDVFYVWGPDVATVQTRFMGLGSTPCAGADGSACTSTAGASGTCHTMRCCVGCWDGTRCNPPGTPTACGVGGGSCSSCADTDPCTSDVCGTMTGTCTHPPAPIGTSCDDGLFCTATDQCNATGTCVGAGAPCDDGNPCTMETCVEASHMCSGHTPLPDGAACSGFPAGICHAGLCCSGCWDGAACQTGTSAAVCGIAGSMCRSCVDGQQCTDDLCTAGTCSNPNSSTSTGCDDGLYCTTGDHCDGMNHCSSGVSTPCDDGSTCTTDGCDEASHGCTHMPAMGICAIFGSCFPMGTMNPSNPCQVCDPTRNPSGWSPAAVGAACGLPSCTGTMLTPAPTCSATGACTPGTRMACPGGTCASPTMCATTCSMDSDCGSTGFCDMTTMMCAPRLTPGTTCDRTTECETGVCSSDHHCCVAACAAGCESCAVPGNLGRCLPVPAGTDPDGECAAGETCNAAGTCTGSGTDAGTPRDAGGTTDAGSATDSGTPGDAGMMAVDATTAHDAGTHTMSAGGCCNVAGTSDAPGALVLGLLGLVVVARRRRASRSI